MKITKALRQAIEEKAAAIVIDYNPYIKRATQYFVGGEPRYIYANQVMTRSEIDLAYLDTAIKDMQRGFEERLVGYYDKWYRYNHADEGRAYDAGVRMACELEECPIEFHVIECNP